VDDVMVQILHAEERGTEKKGSNCSFSVSLVAQGPIYQRPKTDRTYQSTTTVSCYEKATLADAQEFSADGGARN
jgi:hypothetical protein